MTDELNKFSEFYKIKHGSHKLDWDHALGIATLRANFKAGPKELSVSLYQAAILLLFNETSEVPFREIKSQTSMGTAPTIRVFASTHSVQMMLNCEGRCKVWHAARSVCFESIPSAKK